MQVYTIALMWKSVVKRPNLRAASANLMQKHMMYGKPCHKYPMMPDPNIRTDFKLFSLSCDEIQSISVGILNRIIPCIQQNDFRLPTFFM